MPVGTSGPVNRHATALLLALLLQPAAAYDKDYIDGISRRLADRSAAVRDRAAQDANNAGEAAASAVPALAALVERERDAGIRAMAVQALGMTGKASPLAPATLATILRGDPEARIRAKAAEALGRLGTGAPQAVPALLAAFADPSDEVRRAAAEALGAYPGSADTIVPALAAGLGDEDVASGGLAALRTFGAAAAPAVPALRQYIAAPGRNESLRRSAVWTLSRIGRGAAAAAPECLALLDHRNPATRVAAADALLAFGLHTEAAHKVLAAALSTNQGRTDLAGIEQRRDVVIDAAATLARHGAQAGGEALVGLADAAADPISSEMRRFAANAFDEVLAAQVKAGRFDAIESLDEARRFLAASPDEATRVRSRRIGAAVEELKQHRPLGARLREFAAPAVGAAVLAVLAAAAWWWHRRRRGGPHVFISYRRQDSTASCGRLYDHLLARLGEGRVFRDVDSMAPGTPFARRLQEAIAACDAFVLLIGPSWLTMTDDSGRRRLDDPQDFVRLEVEAALAAGKPVFPVLVEGASMPAAAELPASIGAVSASNALEITDRHFAGEVARLVAAMRAARSR